MEKRVPIYQEPRQSIVALQHLSFVATKIYFFISRSKVIVQEDWLPDPGTRYVIASNHLGRFDPFIVTTALGWKRLRPLLPCRFIAASKFLSLWWLETPMRKLGAYPSHPFKDWPYGLDASVYLLEQDSTVVIFPQGRMTHDRTLPAKRGVKVLAELDDVQVVPVCLAGNGKFFRQKVIVGTPQNMSRLSADEIMGKIFELDRENEILKP
jgi:1-acyl-sn-glycerol-3-phosphate acyltransferase